MKSFIILCLVVLIGLSAAGIAGERGCYYILGKCVGECEEGTHAYTTGCGYLTREATCENPNPQVETDGGAICDYSSCYCDKPNVRDTTSNKCIPLDQCPKSSGQ